MTALGICVLTYEEVEATTACLAALRAAGFLERARVVLVDNDSSPGVREALQAWVRREVDPAACWTAPGDVGTGSLGPGLHLLRSARNGGYAAGNNLALGVLLSAGCDWLWVINNDVDVAAVSADVLLAELDHATPDEALGFRLHDPRLPAGSDVLGGGSVQRLRGRTRFATVDAPTPVEFLSGAGLLLSARALRDVGLLSEDHFLYWEDTELCWRLRSSGYRLRVLETLTLEHHTGSTTGSFATGKSRLVHRESARSCMLFYRRHLPGLVWLAAAARAAQAVQVSLGGDPRGGLAVLAGLVSGLRATLSPAPRAC